MPPPPPPPPFIPYLSSRQDEIFLAVTLICMPPKQKQPENRNTHKYATITEGKIRWLYWINWCVMSHPWRWHWSKFSNTCSAQGLKIGRTKLHPSQREWKPTKITGEETQSKSYENAVKDLRVGIKGMSKIYPTANKGSRPPTMHTQFHI